MKARKRVLIGLFAVLAVFAGAACDPGYVFYEDNFDGANSLITNEYAFDDPADPYDVPPSDAVVSPKWNMDSGTFLRLYNYGFTGVPNSGTPDADSNPWNNSVIFRLVTKQPAPSQYVHTETDLTDYETTFKLQIQDILDPVPSTSVPAVDWDGVHVFMRYESEVSLYYASIARRDGKTVFKKKCPGGTSNGGTYHDLVGTPANYVTQPFPEGTGTFTDVKVTIETNTNGSVTLKQYRNGTLVHQATDTGTGCSVIAHGQSGIRGDNTQFLVDDWKVTAI